MSDHHNQRRDSGKMKKRRSSEKKKKKKQDNQANIVSNGRKSNEKKNKNKNKCLDMALFTKKNCAMLILLLSICALIFVLLALLSVKNNLDECQQILDENMSFVHFIFILSHML